MLVSDSVPRVINLPLIFTPRAQDEQGRSDLVLGKILSLRGMSRLEQVAQGNS